MHGSPVEYASIFWRALDGDEQAVPGVLEERKSFITKMPDLILCWSETLRALDLGTLPFVKELENLSRLAALKMEEVQDVSIVASHLPPTVEHLNLRCINPLEPSQVKDILAKNLVSCCLRNISQGAVPAISTKTHPKLKCLVLSNFDRKESFEFLSSVPESNIEILGLQNTPLNPSSGFTSRVKIKGDKLRVVFCNLFSDLVVDAQCEIEAPNAFFCQQKIFAERRADWKPEYLKIFVEPPFDDRFLGFLHLPTVPYYWATDWKELLFDQNCIHRIIEGIAESFQQVGQVTQVPFF